MQYFYLILSLYSWDLPGEAINKHIISNQMLDSLITSKTRIKLLLKFFLNPSLKAYLRGLSDEFGESTNAIRLELNHLEEAGLLRAQTEGNKKVYHSNPEHPLFNDIRNLVLKHSGITQVIEEVVERVGDISKVWVCGDFAIGKDADLIDLVVSGCHINMQYFNFLKKKAEEIVKRQIHYVIISPDQETSYFKQNEVPFLVWKK